MGEFRASFQDGGALTATFRAADSFSADFGEFYSQGGMQQLEPATDTTLGGIIVGEDLQITEEGVLSIVKAWAAEEDNTRPITSAAVYTEIGNINALLQTI